MGVLERIAEIENEMNKTQKNKATAKHVGLLKAQLAKLRRELIEPKGGGAGTVIQIDPQTDRRCGSQSDREQAEQDMALESGEDQSYIHRQACIR